VCVSLCVYVPLSVCMCLSLSVFVSLSVCMTSRWPEQMDIGRLLIWLVGEDLPTGVRGTQWLEHGVCPSPGPGCFETKPAVDGPVLAKLGASRGGQVT